MRACNDLSLSECLEKENELINQGYHKTNKCKFTKLDPGEYRITDYFGDDQTFDGPKRYDLKWNCLTA